VPVQVSPTPKPGYLTTEFWSTQIVHLLTLVSMVLTLNGHTFHDTALTPLVPTAAILASGIAQGWYSYTRGKLKTEVTSLAASTINAIDPAAVAALVSVLTQAQQAVPTPPTAPPAAPVDVQPPEAPQVA
jgi:ABC-type transporter Mla MlaB component